MSLPQLFNKYNIDYQSDGAKSTKGFVNVRDCPFCNSHKYHLGFSLNGKAANCWQCSNKNVVDAMSKVLGVSKQESFDLLSKYADGFGEKNTTNKTTRQTKPFKRPSGITELTKLHKRYLASRNFDWRYIQNMWGVKGTSFTSRLDKTSHKYRLYIPFYWNGQEVTFQTRDVTNKKK